MTFLLSQYSHFYDYNFIYWNIILISSRLNDLLYKFNYLCFIYIHSFILVQKNGYCDALVFFSWNTCYRSWRYCWTIDTKFSFGRRQQGCYLFFKSLFYNAIKDICILGIHISFRTNSALNADHRSNCLKDMHKNTINLVSISTYDGYLKANIHSLGIISHGLCKNSIVSRSLANSP